MKIKEVQELAHENAIKKGFWEQDEHLLSLCTSEEERQMLQRHLVSSRIMLIVTECSEAMEDVRGDSPLGEELADVVIRVADLCGRLNINLQSEVQSKIKYNAHRKRKHGKNL